MTQRKPSSIYAKFMYLAQVVRGLELFPTLDPLEERLLNQLAALWAMDRRVTVLDAMTMSPDVEPAAVYRCLTSLRQKGMLQLEGEQTDHPSRYLVATPMADTYFARLEQCMRAAAKC